MEKRNWISLENIHKIVNNPDQIEQTITEVRSMLWFKKIIAFWWWWNITKVSFNDNDIKLKIEDYSNQVKEKILNEIIWRLRDYDIAILTWWTIWDIPQIATKIARKYWLPTIWVLPKRWEKNSLWKNNLLNIEIIVDSLYSESYYWDESSIFAKLLDGMFVLWWWAWTLIEFSHVMKMNESLSKNWYVKKVVPINWIWWLSEVIHHIPWNDEIKQLSLPKVPIYNWEDAFNWMKDELALNDILKETY